MLPNATSGALWEWEYEKFKALLLTRCSVAFSCRCTASSSNSARPLGSVRRRPLLLIERASNAAQERLICS